MTFSFKFNNLKQGLYILKLIQNEHVIYNKMKKNKLSLNMIKKLLILTTILFSLSVPSQNKKCNTTFLMNKLFEEMREMKIYIMKQL